MQKCDRCGRKFDAASFGNNPLCPVCGKRDGAYRRCPVCKTFNTSAINNCEECGLLIQSIAPITPAGIVDQYPVLIVSLTEKGKELVEG